MAYIKTGTVTDDPVGAGDPKRIFITSRTTPTYITLKSEGGTKTELSFNCPAFDSKEIRATEIRDRIPMGRDLTITIHGDSNSFVRIDF